MDNGIKKLSLKESRELDRLVNQCDMDHYESRNENLRADHGGKPGDMKCPIYRKSQAQATAYDYQMMDFEDWFSGR